MYLPQSCIDIFLLYCLCLLINLFIIIFGQTLFVPENQTETRIPAENPSSEPVTKPPQPLNVKVRNML